MRDLAASTVEKKADVVLLMVDAARRSSERSRFLFAEMVKIALQYARKEVILVLNKVDLVNPKSILLERTHEYVSLINGVKLGPERAHEAALDTTTFMISALNNDGVLDLKNYLIRKAEQKEWLLQPSQGITTLTHEERIEEIILEKLLENVHDEIPYSAEITCKEILYDLHMNGKVMKVTVDILVESARHRKIILGHAGRTMVKIRQSAVMSMETIFPKKQVILMFDIRSKKG